MGDPKTDVVRRYLFDRRLRQVGQGGEHLRV
jgi:hypothetical protein